MPTRLNPVFTYGHSEFIIERQRDDCGAADERETRDFDTTATPSKMVRLLLSSGIKQRYPLPAEWIDFIGLRPFVLVAEFTSQTEISRIIRATSDDRQNMIDLKPSHHIILVTFAVFATIRGTLPNLLAGRWWDIVHAGSGFRNPRRTDSASASDLRSCPSW